MTTSTAPTASSDRIEKEFILEAPRSRVWRALTDVQQFNTWFGVGLTSPFTPGAEVSGQITIPNYEHMTMRIWIEKIEPEAFFSYRWHPHAVEKDFDYSAEPTTLVTFRLEAVDAGTKLTIIETGFDAIPIERRLAAFKGNSGGWTSQPEKLRKYVTS